MVVDIQEVLVVLTPIHIRVAELLVLVVDHHQPLLMVVVQQ